jgi:ribose-phosphate pyrophosphokinase
MELLLLVDAAKHAGAYRIIAVVPYFGYSRQDRPSYNYGPISARLVATLLEAAGIDRIITVDLHSKQLEGFFKIGVQNLAATDLFTPFFKDMKNSIVVSPDVGGLIRSRQLAESLDTNLAVINKRRDKQNVCYMSEVIGEVAGKHCVLIDDIVDTASTLCQAAELLIKKGALSVEACVTHPVLSADAVERIEASAIKRIFVTNSIPTATLPAKFYVIQIEELLKDAIAKLIKN